MPNRNIVVIGASAGGVEALSLLVKALPADLPASVFIVLHVPSTGTSVLPNILRRAGSLPVLHPQDQTLIQSQLIYVAPPDYHLLVWPNQIRLSHGPRQNGHRPSVDALFNSAAHFHRQRVIGVILSGSLDDGTVGLMQVKRHGGVAIAQNPQEALFPSMPQSAIEHVPVDYVLNIAEIATTLVKLTQASGLEKLTMTEHTPKPDSEAVSRELEQVAQEKDSWERGRNLNTSSLLTCPDCGGLLWELQEDNLLRYHCHVGHVYSLDSLLDQQASVVEKALWSAVRSLEERAALSRRLAHRAAVDQRVRSQSHFQEQADTAQQDAAIVRQVLLSGLHNSNAGASKTELELPQE